MKRMIVQFKPCNTTKSLKIRLVKGFLLYFWLNLWFLRCSLWLLSWGENLVWISISWKIHDFFEHGGKTWRSWAIIYALLLHSFLPCKENLIFLLLHYCIEYRLLKIIIVCFICVQNVMTKQNYHQHLKVNSTKKQ